MEMCSHFFLFFFICLFLTQSFIALKLHVINKHNFERMLAAAEKSGNDEKKEKWGVQIFQVNSCTS